MHAAFGWSTLQEASRDACPWAGGGQSEALSVTTSSTSLARPAFATCLLELLGHQRQPMVALVLELTECDPAPDIDTVRDNASLLTAHGARLSLDDFDSGPSGLAVRARIRAQGGPRHGGRDRRMRSACASVATHGSGAMPLWTLTVSACDPMRHPEAANALRALGLHLSTQAHEVCKVRFLDTSLALATLQLSSADDVSLLLIVRHNDDAQNNPAESPVRANLMAPLVLNTATRRGLQKVIGKVDTRVTLRAVA